MYMIPTIGILGAIGLGFWCVKKILNHDDSADDKAVELISKIPDLINNHIEITHNENNKCDLTLKNILPGKKSKKEEKIINKAKAELGTDNEI